MTHRNLARNRLLKPSKKVNGFRIGGRIERPTMLFSSLLSNSWINYNTQHYNKSSYTITRNTTLTFVNLVIVICTNIVQITVIIINSLHLAVLRWIIGTKSCMMRMVICIINAMQCCHLRVRCINIHFQDSSWWSVVFKLHSSSVWTMLYTIEWS